MEVCPLSSLPSPVGRVQVLPAPVGGLDAGGHVLVVRVGGHLVHQVGQLLDREGGQQVYLVSHGDLGVVEVSSTRLASSSTERTASRSTSSLMGSPVVRSLASSRVIICLKSQNYHN